MWCAGLVSPEEMISRLPLLIRSPSPSLHHRRLSAAFASPPTHNLHPLFLRPLTYSTTPSDLRTFRHWAESLAHSAAPKIVASDPNGPSAAHLTRELSWLLQDAASETADTIHLRVPLQDLYSLWRLRVEERKPFQYIVGCEHWRDLVLAVREGVLIPRPETEMIVDLVTEVDGFEEGLWADLGTGSGALAVGIGRMLGESGRVVGIDLSAEAVELARFNVERYGLQEKVEIRQGSWFEPLEDLKGKLAGLVSNPPYIPSSQISGLQVEVGKHEPRLALDGGESGMNYLIHLCEGCAAALKPSGFFAFETNGDIQSEFIADLLSTKFGELFHNVKTVSDLAKIRRFVTGFRR